MGRRKVSSCLVRGRRWVVEPETRCPKGQLGGCEDAGIGFRFRRIQIPMDGDTRDELDTIIHEVLHAATELDECAVEGTANAISRLLWRLGWRKEID